MEPIKLHIGCGSVYLKNWVNIDLPSDNCFLASDRPELIEQFITEDTDYYGRHKQIDLNRFKAGFSKQNYICDRYGSFQNIPAQSNSASHILSRQVFEHFEISNAILALKESHRVLQLGGILTIDVPDTEESIKLYGKTQDPFYIRHIVGPKSRGSWGFHCMSYNGSELANLVESNGFRSKSIDENIHLYPAICASFEKI